MYLIASNDGGVLADTHRNCGNRAGFVFARAFPDWAMEALDEHVSTIDHWEDPQSHQVTMVITESSHVWITDGFADHERWRGKWHA